jgi:hypothetical protein
MEQTRLQDARDFDPHASLSTSASPRGKGRPKKDETAQERKQTKAREVEKPKKSAKRPAAAAATAVEPPVQEARGKAKGSSVVTAAVSKKPRAENQKQAARATEETNGRNRNGQPRGLSKAVGDRVYARWSNGQWYWGRITDVVRNGKAVLYRVRMRSLLLRECCFCTCPRP